MHQPIVRPCADSIDSDLVKSAPEEIPIMKYSADLSSSLRICKRVIDVGAALSFFLLFGWLYLALWIVVLITSGGPGIYSQLRYGQHGKLFKFYKFRSMVANADEVLVQYLKTNKSAREQWERFQKLDHDPRITKFGQFIRKTSLDELPQFWNVLKGDMSLIGPRPCMSSQMSLYGQYWPFYCAVKPGITGLWQVSGRNRLTFENRVALDVRYVRDMSLANDLSIALKTFVVVLTGHGSR